MKKLIWFFLCLVFHSYSQTPGNGVTDIDGNQYNSVIIGTQEWMKENLNASKYSDGTIIPQVTDPTQWANLTTGAWCYYDNTTFNGTTYGKLYNWYAVVGIYDAASDANPALRKKLAPTGWHVPTDVEWTQLTDCLGGESVAGGKMKSTGTSLWQSPNTAATNQSGFTGRPAGYRYLNGTVSSRGLGGYWWSSSNGTTTSAWLRLLDFTSGLADRVYYNKKSGISVRCLNNNLLTNSTFEINSIILYPNPVINILNIKTNENLINQTFTIIDSLGRVVLYGKLNEVESTINVEQLSKGIYYLIIDVNSASKFIKE